jgi:hypothetical protein
MNGANIFGGNVILKGAGNLKRTYGYEYIGDHFDCFICPGTERSMISLYRSINNTPKEWSAIGMFNAQKDCGMGVIINYLADFCGEALVKTTMGDQQQYRYYVFFIYLSFNKLFLLSCHIIPY